MSIKLQSECNVKFNFHAGQLTEVGGLTSK